MTDDRSSISAIVIPTCSRPWALKRCLSGMLANLSAFGRRPRIVIADGSADQSSASTNREIILQFRRQGWLEIALIGPEEKGRLVDSLASSGLDRKVIDFAVNGFTNLGIVCPGANRNVLLLACLGDRFLSLDDDTQFLFACADQFTSYPGANKQSVRLSTNNPIQHWFYENRNSLLQSVQFENTDFLSCHERVLGRDVPDLPLPEEKNGDSTVNVAFRREAGRVLITLSGVIGDCGWGSPSRYLFLKEESLERLTASEEAYLKATTSREMAQVSPDLCLSERVDDLMSTAFAGDGRFMFAPFIPIGRGEDISFGQLLKRMRPDVWFGHVPYAILHAPLKKRCFWPGEIHRSAASTNLSVLLSSMIRSLGTDTNANANDTDPNPLFTVGRALTDIGTLPTLAFRNYLNDCRRASTQTRCRLLEERLLLPSASVSAYAADVKSHIRRLLEGDKRNEGAVPAELLYGRELEAAFRLTQQVILLYGHLLCAWPDMVRASGYLRECSASSTKLSPF